MPGTSNKKLYLWMPTMKIIIKRLTLIHSLVLCKFKHLIHGLLNIIEERLFYQEVQLQAMASLDLNGLVIMVVVLSISLNLFSDQCQ